MLNIGRLGSDIESIVNYYLASVPSPDGVSAVERYYLDHGDNPGRWVGSLSAELQLDGPVHEEGFRRLLQGSHPLTGEALTKSGKPRSRPVASRRPTVGADQDQHLNVRQAADRLGVEPRRVRRLLSQGDLLDEDDRRRNPASYLLGEKVRLKSGPGRASWSVADSELQRFEHERKSKAARPGFDLTLRPTKSVSILWALGRPEHAAVIAKAHQQSVDYVIDYYERQAVFSRKRVEGEQYRQLANGVVGAAFDHRTSRAGDPLLHTHVVVFNLTRAVDGKWRALDGTPLYENAKAGGYLYQAQMRELLRRDLGVEWTPVVNGTAEIVGIPDSVIKVFSKRRDEIEEAVAEHGHSSPKAHQAATLASRRPKEVVSDPKVEEIRWWDEAESLGFTAEQLDACVGTVAEVETAPPSEERAAALLAELGSPTGITEMMSTFSRRDAICQLIDKSGQPIWANAIERLSDKFVATSAVTRMSTGLDVVLGADDKRSELHSLSRYSTPELLAKEAALLTWPTSDEKRMPMLSTQSTDVVIAAHAELTSEQIVLVRTACTHDRGVVAVAGTPGSGKTHAIGIAVEALAEQRIPVIGVALGAEAASELEDATRLKERTRRGATTVAGLLIELDDTENGGLAPGTVLIVDEASMVGTRDAFRLMQHVRNASGSMIMIGDPDQHGSVEAGGFYRSFVSTHPELVVHLSKNNRQLDEVERQAIELYRNGDVDAALENYDGAGKIVRSATSAESNDAMVADWYARRTKGDESPMIAGPNRLRRELNNRARSILESNGELFGETVVASDREFRAGDRVVAKKNDRRLRGTEGDYIKNGSTGDVVSVDDEQRRLTINFDREGTVVLPAWYLDGGHLDHGYARTTYGLQGKTLENGSYRPTDVSSFEEGYVALSRSRSETRIYLTEGESEPESPLCGDEAKDPESDLVVRALERRRAKLMAHDLYVNQSPENDAEVSDCDRPQST
jgi:conjugative relaxase-like TrwC/TraI family protein